MTPDEIAIFLAGIGIGVLGTVGFLHLLFSLAKESEPVPMLPTNNDEDESENWLNGDDGEAAYMQDELLVGQQVER